MRRWIAVCKVALILVTTPCFGAEVFYMDHDPYSGAYVGAVGPLVISGEIEIGRASCRERV